ncbi:hypothetical protein TRFO_14786 [Tritrichomonas foetus]|uniref:Uncharacterized protein n=1 Tax=Tritrichomonas foetus TaxID=1144522 RepID=A0A1J4KU79_9EUKA|nr:hypothetical protein TRFO_14786 [Tritrichomonas foetus]|eukprot:OHT14833.1 hypothetical protein TRFO_14786 [Tritrichomonas foetus]
MSNPFNETFIDTSELYESSSKQQKLKQPLIKQESFERDNSILQSPEKNYLTFSDQKFRSILDRYLYLNSHDTSRANVEKFLNPEISPDQIRGNDFIVNFFGVFGFQYEEEISKNDPEINLFEIFTIRLFQYFCPFLEIQCLNDINENKNKIMDYFKINFNENKAKMYWKKNVSDSFPYFPITSQEIPLPDCFNFLLNPFEYVFCNIHNIGISTKHKIYIFYILQESKEKDTNVIHPILLGDENSNNCIFIGLMNRSSEKLRYSLYFPKMTILEDHQQPNKKEKSSGQIEFLPNSAPIYRELRKQKKVNLMNMQENLFNKSFSFFYGSYPTLVEHQLNLPGKNQHIISSLSDIRTMNDTIHRENNGKMIDAENESHGYLFAMNYILSLLGTKDDNKCYLTFNKNNKQLEFQADFRNVNHVYHIYQVYLITPFNNISSFPIFQLSSSLQLKSLYVDSLNRVYFVASKNINQTTEIILGEGDFGTQSLDDMYIIHRFTANEYLGSAIIPYKDDDDNPVNYKKSHRIIVIHTKNKSILYNIYTKKAKVWKEKVDIVLKTNETELCIIYKNDYSVTISFKGENIFMDQDRLSDLLNNKDKSIAILDDRISINLAEENILNQNELEIILENLLKTKMRTIFYDSQANDITNSIFKNNIIMKEIQVLNEMKNCEDVNFLVNTQSQIQSSPVAYEINDKLFLKRYQSECTLFHPARKNDQLLYFILNSYYQLRSQTFSILKNQTRANSPLVLFAHIKIGYSGPLFNDFTTGTAPGIYLQFPDNNDDDDYQSENTLNQICLYFNNGHSHFNIRSNNLRLKAQLAAAFACAYKIRIYDSFNKVIDYQPVNENIEIWTTDVCDKMYRSMIATYGTLLEMRTAFEFSYALNILETTKGMVNQLTDFSNKILNK